MNAALLALRPHERIVFDDGGGAPWRSGQQADPGVLRWGDSADASPLLRHADLREELRLTPTDRASARSFQRMRERTDMALAQPRALPRSRLELTCWAFRRRVWESPIDLAVDDRTATSVERVDASVTTPQAAIEWLTEECVIRVGGSTFVVVSGIPLDAPIAPRFKLHGATRSVEIESAKSALHVVRVTPPERLDERALSTLALAAGELRFVDRTHARLLADEFNAHLEEIDDAEHLRAWDAYAALEVARAIAAVRQLGAIRYVDAFQQSDTIWRVTLEDPGEAERLDEAESYHAVPEVPGTLLQGGTSAEVLERLRNETRVPALELVGRPRQLLELRIRRLPLDGTIPELPSDGYLVLSRAAAGVQLKRRASARARLGRHHGLSLALSGRRPPDPVRAIARLPEPLPPEVEEVFRHGSTPGQRAALKAVFENPGVTVIQGPPGTGKSTVIAALHRLLARGDRDNARRSIVVCAPQHEAVDNVAGKIDVLGLPPYRIGAKVAGASLETWIRDHAARIEQQLRERCSGDAHLPERVEALRRTAARYCVAPENVARTARVLYELADQGGRPAEDGADDATPLLSADLRQRLRERADELDARLQGDLRDWRERRRRARRCAALLRLTPAAFADDGPVTAARARAGLAALGLLDDAAREVLDSAIATTTDDVAPLAGLAAVRATLLDRLAATSELDSASVRDARATELAGEVVGELGAWLAANVDPVERVLRRLLDRIAHEPDAVTDAVQRYAVALSATLQGVGSTEFADLAANETRTAIVDEAGRGNPLDVLIPLVTAAERQVLVGDHRQLPQFLEPDLVEKAAEQMGPAIEAALRQSLFERLFTTLEGTPRCETLREQFRMHSELALFVSRTFYGPKEQFKSVRADHEFAHGLGGRYRDRIAVWLDVTGNETSGQSKSRPIEAKRIAEEVKALMGQAPRLTFGIVTMYAAQLREIRASLRKVGVLHPSGEGLAMAPEERYVLDDAGQPISVDGKSVERLAVGTVDGFQGREFDVVFVSLVRSNQRPNPRARFGHVAMPNRLNVAMSRQRRLLVVCGDRATFLDGDAATWDDAAPFRAFDKLCAFSSAGSAGSGR